MGLCTNQWNKPPSPMFCCTKGHAPMDSGAEQKSMPLQIHVLVLHPDGRNNPSGPADCTEVHAPVDPGIVWWATPPSLVHQ